ncbi:cation:proton antiporter [Flexibacterium corallicola]|uniref:cation:proton antiporter n=1 Tax=Flexibacterium corallicola TaxID=3037259 RepID=UPI00286F3EE4|nr:cation:proton antiporter [Pseudovibrio sp. M1P-2-3]
MIYQDLTIIFAVVFFYSIASKALERKPVNGALLFCLVGLAFGSYGLGWVQLDISTESIRLLAELALAVVLFTDAAQTNLKTLAQNIALPRSLLLYGLPMTIILGAFAGLLLFPSLPILEIVLLAALLAPTDAALGKAVVTDKHVPPTIRETLTVESGLNDGICVPIVFTVLAVALKSSEFESVSQLAATLFVKQIGMGIVIGISLAMITAKSIEYAHHKGWITRSWEQLIVVAIAICCFSVAQLSGGSGFIAAFVGGLTFGSMPMSENSTTYQKKLVFTAEGIGDTLALGTWIIFGASVVGKIFTEFSWQIFLYSLLSLTVVRMLPVFISLSGHKLSTYDKLFMGWFGPRGLASIVFTVIILDANLPNSPTLASIAVCTIALSVFLHGLSTHPLINRLGRAAQK